MVENQFLERLNLLMQYIFQTTKPMGGKQVIFVGDFHQASLSNSGLYLAPLELCSRNAVSVLSRFPPAS